MAIELRDLVDRAAEAQAAAEALPPPPEKVRRNALDFPAGLVRLALVIPETVTNHGLQFANLMGQWRGAIAAAPDALTSEEKAAVTVGQALADELKAELDAAAVRLQGVVDRWRDRIAKSEAVREGIEL